MTERERVLVVGYHDELEMLAAGEDLPAMNILTFEGTARSGKGTTVTAVSEALISDGRTVKVIDQGKKFRALTWLGIGDGLDLHNPNTVSSFLSDSETRARMLGMMSMVTEMDAEQEQVTLYSNQVKNVVSKVGQNSLSHALVVGIMFDEVSQAASTNIDTVLIDGRSIEKYAWRMDQAKIGMYVNGYYFDCDSFVAARRVLKNFTPLNKMTTAERLALLAEIDNIQSRNTDDMNRDVDPMQYPDHAYRLDLTRGLPVEGARLSQEYGQLYDTKLVAVNTGYTTSIEQMTSPITAIARQMLYMADEDRVLWQRKLEKYAQSGPAEYWVADGKYPARLVESR